MNIDGQFWFSVDDAAFLGEERIALLEQIAADALARRGIVEQGLACAIFPAASVIVGVDN